MDSNEGELTISSNKSAGDIEDWNEDEFVGCSDDSIKCIVRSRWFHEGCSKFKIMCGHCDEKEENKCLIHNSYSV